MTNNREIRVGDVYTCKDTRDKRNGRTLTVKSIEMYKVVCASFNPTSVSTGSREVRISKSRISSCYELTTVGPDPVVGQAAAQ